MSNIEVKIEFEGIDSWNRPVYKQLGTNVRIGSVDVLFPNRSIAPNNTRDEIDAYFRNNKNKLVIFGTTFDEDDPLGTNIKANIQLTIITKQSKTHEL